jgi:hypothetical protein
MTAPWPRLDDTWQDTCETLHRWLQIVGKVRASLAPWTNHEWHSALQVTSRGLGTGLVPAGSRGFSIDLDLICHRLRVATTDGQAHEFALRSEPVAEFYSRFSSVMSELGIALCFLPRPDEVPDRTPFSEDRHHATYDAEAAHRYWEALIRVTPVFESFRAGFVGKSSPVQLFWGGMDLCVSRFSGRPAPEHPGGMPGLPDAVVKEAYSHEEMTFGFWPGDARQPLPAFYAYAYPEPAGFKEARILPVGAYYHSQLREFILPYEQVRRSGSPENVLRSFLDSTYEAGAELARWDRKLLEDSPYLKQLQRRQRERCGQAA